MGLGFGSAPLVRIDESAVQPDETGIVTPHDIEGHLAEVAEVAVLEVDDGLLEVRRNVSEFLTGIGCPHSK